MKFHIGKFREYWVFFEQQLAVDLTWIYYLKTHEKWLDKSRKVPHQYHQLDYEYLEKFLSPKNNYKTSEEVKCYAITRAN